MKKLSALIFLCGIIILAQCCEKQNDFGCSKGKIIAITCGGTVVQFLDSASNIGTEWRDFNYETFPTYSNCVLVGNLNSQAYTKDDTIFFYYNKVEHFSDGNFCDIGALPETKIEISELTDSNCSKE